MVWVGRDLKDHLVPTSLPWAGTSSSRPGCSKPHPNSPGKLPGKGHLQILWATYSSASPPSIHTYVYSVAIHSSLYTGYLLVIDI